MATNGPLSPEYLTLAQAWPTMLPVSKEVFFDKCCALHKVVDHDQQGEQGCAGQALGSHRSIRAMSEKGVVYCHAEVGQRVIDWDLFSNVVYQDGKFVERARCRGSNFKKRYFGGYPASVKLYGAGYCYLIPFEDSVRSRVARCLGPLPLLADVVRFAFYVGARACPNVEWRFIEGIGWHLEEGSGGLSVVACREFIRRAMGILSESPNVRVGMDSESVNELRVGIRAVVEAKNGRRDEVVEFSRVAAVEDSVSTFDPLSVVWRVEDADDEVFGDERLKRIHAWFNNRGIVLRRDVDQLLLSATCASVFLNKTKSFMKSDLKMWAVYGDSVMKLIISDFCLSQHYKPVDYTTMHARTENASLTKLFLASGLRSCGYLYGLSEDSSRNADMFEALVGIIASAVDKTDLVKFLTVTGVLKDEFRSIYEIRTADSVSVDSSAKIGLSSYQYGIAIKLAEAGVI